MRYLTILALTCSTMLCYAQNRILIDGVFDDWEDYPVLYTDAMGDGGFGAADFGQLQIHNDDEFIFFFLETGVEINLQDLNEITLYLDTDNNASTGFSINGIGADLSYAFGNRSGVFYHSGTAFSIFHNDIGLVTAPTVTSNKFEIAIRRDATISGNPVFTNNQIKVVFEDDFFGGDLLPVENELLEYNFSSANPGPLPEFSIQKPQESDLRILSYNVLVNGLFDQDRLPAFTRIFQAIQPDIMGFQEIYDHSSAEVANQIESILPSAAGEQWYHAKEGPDCHAISRYPILESALIPGSNPNAGNGAFLIEIPEMETEMLLIVAHPPCCDNNFERQIEVDLIMAFLREAKNGNGPIPLAMDAPIVILGDMNLVGNHRQLETLLTGDIFDEASYGPDFNPDWDGNDLQDSHPFTTGVPFSYTWYNQGSSFSPGRLDFIIYSESNLLLQNKFSLFTPSLPSDSLTAFNLLANDVTVASDHLPLVTDFKLKTLTAQNNLRSQGQVGLLNIYPNPTVDQATVSFQLTEQDLVTFQLMDQSGKVISNVYQNHLNRGEHNIQINTRALAAGIYFLKMETSSFTSYEKMVVIK